MTRYLLRYAQGSLRSLIAASLALSSALYAEEPLPTPADVPLAAPIVVPAAPAPIAPIATSQSGAGVNALLAAPAVQGLSSLPIAAGRIPATFAVSNSGAATYTIPIEAPPGVGPVQVKLALTYN